MKLYQKVIVYSSVIAGLLGCDENTQNTEDTQKETPKYFATLPMGPESGMGLTNGDFDGDGDLDVIVGVRPWAEQGQLYLFLNDGKGNFTLKEPQNK